MTAIRPFTRKFFSEFFLTQKFFELCQRSFCGNGFYNTNHSEIRAEMTFIIPITRKFGFFYVFQPKIPVLGQIFQLLQKVVFADSTFIRPITPKFRGGNNFYKTNHSKIHEIRPISPKSDWSFNHLPLYINYQSCNLQL